MTTKDELTAYTGSSDQIDEMRNCNHGFILISSDGMHSDWIYFKDNDFSCIDTFNVTHYWIIPDDPLRKMKIRQAMTGQPVWVRRYSSFYETYEYFDATTTPDWSIPGAEYSFTPFESEHFHKEAGPEDKAIYQSIADNYYKTLTKSKGISGV